MAAALDARPALLDRVIEVNVGTGAVRVTSRGSAVSMRVDAKRGIIGWLTEVAARLQRVVPPPAATPPPHHSILDLLPCHSVTIGDHTMLLTLRVLPTPVGSATPLRAVLHAVVTLRLAHNAPFSSSMCGASTCAASAAWAATIPGFCAWTKSCVRTKLSMTGGP